MLNYGRRFGLSTRALWGGPTGEKKKNFPLVSHLIYTNQGMHKGLMGTVPYPFPLIFGWGSKS
jgi:hypothetical protein